MALEFISDSSLPTDSLFLMKSKFLLLAGILFILSACQDNLKSDDKVQSKPINISVSVVETDESSITVNISAKGVYLEDYDKWGIVYGETDDMSKGKEMTIDGTPSDKTAKFTIGGLKETAEYYIWGWAEGPDLPRVWMSYSVKAKTQKARPSIQWIMRQVKNPSPSIQRKMSLTVILRLTSHHMTVPEHG